MKKGKKKVRFNHEVYIELNYHQIHLKRQIESSTVYLYRGVYNSMRYFSISI